MCAEQETQKLRDLCRNYAEITQKLRRNYADYAEITQKLRRNYACNAKITQKLRKNYAKITQKKLRRLRKNYACVCNLRNLHYYAHPTLLMNGGKLLIAYGGEFLRIGSRYALAY